MQYKNLTIIGTSHISKQSIQEVKDHIEAQKPDIIAIELDKQRLNALLKKQRKSLKTKDLRKIGLTGIIFSILGSLLENKLGKLVDTKPGSEMIAAIKLARKHNIPISLIDQDIRITLQKLSKKLSKKEKFRILFDLLFSSFQKGKIKIDLEKVPDEKTIEMLSTQFKKIYPTVYKILVEDRNKVMAKNLYNLITNNPDKKVLAIVGAGHEKEIIDLLKDAKNI